jgi:carbon monoxide dehydrogenase subunit G
MTTLRERIETRLPVGEAFAFVADFGNAAHWDPGVATSEQIGSGPLGVGTRYRLGVRMAGRVAPMEYRVTAFEPPHRVVLEGFGAGVVAVDDIRFEATPTGTRVDYLADIQLHGVMRLVQPFASESFARIAREAREGMQRALDQLAGAEA